MNYSTKVHLNFEQTNGIKGYIKAPISIRSHTANEHIIPRMNSD